MDYAFEGLLLCGVSRPDVYLSQLYGNYMQLPPPEKRLAHTETIFYKAEADASEVCPGYGKG